MKPKLLLFLFLLSSMSLLSKQDRPTDSLSLISTNSPLAMVDVTFKVNMQYESVSPDGVYIVGSFTDYSGIEMTSTDNVVFTSPTISLEAGTIVYYVFANGGPLNGGDKESWNPTYPPCVNGEENERFLVVPSSNTTLSEVCFEYCSNCPNLLISEVASPVQDPDFSSFIELYNIGPDAINFTDLPIWLYQQTEFSPFSVRLTGNLSPGETYVVSTADFIDYYGFSPNLEFYENIVSGNDAFLLFMGNIDGPLTRIDAFGDVDEATNEKTLVDYTNSKAVRVGSVTKPSPVYQPGQWYIPASATVDEMTPGACKENVDWIRESGADWNTKGNWSGTNGYIPDASYNVTIPNVNSPVISSQAACNNLTINASSSLDLPVNVGLTVYGNLATLGTLTVESSSSGNGSLIVEGTATGSATVQRYMKGYGVNNGWHLISSPVNNMVIAGSDFEPGGNADLYWWEESTNLWKNYKAGAFDFTNGQGYLTAFQGTGTKDFVGTPNTGDIVFSGLTKDNSGFHLLGNPYASALVWNNGDWALSGVGAVAQIWEESNNNYSPIESGGIIPSTNGFFVDVKTAPGSLTIPASARAHNATNNYKNVVANHNKEKLDLKVTNDANMYYDICRVGFKADATEAWDIEYDAHKLFGGAGTSQLWSVLDDEDFVYNYLPYAYEPYQLPVSFRAGVNATHYITAEGVDSFYESSKIFLEDLQTGETINLTEQPIYSFTATTEDPEARFILHFFGVTSVDETMATTEEAQIYAVGQTVYIRFNGQSANYAQVEMFNIIGQQVYAGQLTPQSFSSFQLNEKPGMYIVRIRTENGMATQKVMIQ